MDTNDKTLNSELRTCAKKILEEGITENNCLEIINVLQSILESPYNNIYNDVDFCFLITSLYYVPLNSPLLELLKNNLRDRFLYFQFVKMDNENLDSEWIVNQEIVENDGYKEIIQYNINQKTNEKIELGRTTIENPSNLNIDKVFTGLLNEKTDLKDYEL